MKSVGFFLLVFSGLLLALWLVVDKDSYPDPAVTFEDSGEAFQLDERGNHFELPVFDAEKQRLSYRLTGYLDDRLETLDPEEIDHLILYDGTLEIPIYDDPGEESLAAQEEQVRHIIWEFKRAEFNEEGEKNRLKNTKVVRLSGGGRGETNDGVLIEFIDMEIQIEELFYQEETDAGDNESSIRRKHVYHVHTDKHVQISSELLRIESPAGMTSRLQGKDKLQRIVFNPPVWTYIDAKAAKSFGGESPGRPSQSASAAKGRREPLGKLAITCEGPLVLDRVSEPPRITFEKNVRIYPVQQSTPGESPPVSDSWFLCQIFMLEIDDQKTPPELTLARATWEDGRVKAYHRGSSADGASLTWRRLSPPAQAQGPRWEARLEGDRPKFWQEGLAWQADRAILTLDEELKLDEGIRWEGDIEGHFEMDLEKLSRREAGPTEKISKKPHEGPQGEKGRTVEAENAARKIGIAEKWNFSADTVETRFETDPRKQEPPRAEAEPLVDLKGVSAVVARSESDDGLTIESATPGGGTLRGRLLTYDSQRGSVVLEGVTGLPPRFEHRRASGTAEKIHLLLNERLLRFDNRVSIDLSMDSPGSADSEAEADESLAMEALRTVCEQLDVAFEERAGEILIDSVIARTLGRRPVTLTPISSRNGGYKFEGPVLHWDQQHQTATMDAVEMGPHGSGTLFLPRLHFQDGSLTAHRLRFDRRTWTAYLEDGVEIRTGDPDGLSRSPETSGQTTTQNGGVRSTLIRASRAEVEFFEDFEPRGDEVIGSLRRVRHLHGWEGNDNPITIWSPEFSGQAHQVTWSSEEGALRMFGGQYQEFRRAHEDVLRAEEIVYRLADGRLELRRNVSGQIVLVEHSGVVAPRSSDAEGNRLAAGSDARGPTAEAGTLVWEYKTPALEADLRFDDGSKRLELIRLLASENVVLTCKARGLQLRGDDLEYHHRLREIRVFSRDGRFQTLFHQQKVPAGAGFRVRTSRIDSREIRVWYSKSAAASGPGDDGEDIVVEFEKDVVASFHLPEDVSNVVPSSHGTEDEDDVPWKLEANRLTLHILKQKDSPETTQYAYAEGEVFFSSDSKQLKVMATEATYYSAKNLLNLKGDKSQPVRVIRGEHSIQDPKISIRKVGTKFEIQSRK